MRDSASTAADAAADRASTALHHGKLAGARVAEQFYDMRQQFKRLLEVWVKQKIQSQTEKLIDRLPQIIKDYLEDPDMPRCASHGKDRAVDNIWPDFREEILWEVHVLLDGSRKEQPSEENGPDCFRRFFRYHIYPYNKSFWGRLRDPVWVIVMLCSIIPVSGAVSIVYLFLFLIIDKSDEYQLVYFILHFKGTQFFSHGVLRSVMGFFLYLSCVTIPAQEDQHSCERIGPGLAGWFELILGGWMLQEVLMWIAWALLPYSRPKGRSALKGKIGEFEHTRRSMRRGGYMGPFLLYDLVCFIVCSIALVIVATLRHQSDNPLETREDWTVAHALFACQVVYGYCAAPFFLFTLPLLEAVLTHAVPTGYDLKGRCVKYRGSTRSRDTTVKSGGEEEVVSKEDANKLLDKIKTLFVGGSVDLECMDEEATPGGKASKSEVALGPSQPTAVLPTTAAPIVVGASSRAADCE